MKNHNTAGTVDNRTSTRTTTEREQEQVDLIKLQKFIEVFMDKELC